MLVVNNKFAVAMTIFALLAALAWWALSDPKLRLVTLALLALFAFKTWLHHRKSLLDECEDEEGFRHARQVRDAKS